MSKERVYLAKQKENGSFRDLGRRIMAIIKPPIKGRVLIKPNLTCPAFPREAITTHPNFCADVIEWLKAQSRVSEVGIAEGAGYAEPSKMEEVFEKIGFKALSETMGVSLINLNAQKSVELAVPQSLCLPRIKVAKTLLEYDWVINLPVLKTHALGITTLGMKNLMGFVLPADKKEIIHQRFNEIWRGPCQTDKRAMRAAEFEEAKEDFGQRLVDLTRAVINQVPLLVVVDGSLGREGDGFFDGQTKKMGVALAGTNVAAVDGVATILMGFRPKRFII